MKVTEFARWDITKIYVVVGLGFLMLTASFYFLGFKPLTDRLTQEYSEKIEHFLESGAWLLESVLKKHVSLVQQSASRTAIRNKQIAYLRGDVSREELIAFSAPKLADAVKAESEIVGISRFDPGGQRLYDAGLAAPESVAVRCDFPKLDRFRQFKPMLIGGKRRLVYCSPISDKQYGHVGYDVVMLEESSLQAVIDAGDASNINIMFLFVTEQARNILFQPALAPGLPTTETLQAHIAQGIDLPGFIVKSRQLSDSQWQAHAVVNETLFFAEVRQQMMVLAGAVVAVMLLVFLLTVIALRPLIRALLQEAKLIEISHRDGLTGLYNHRHMQEQLERELTRALRSQQALSVVMFDIDHFKRVNDEHGHQAGDEVLRRVAQQTQKCMRAGDLAARYGGEEFLLILPDTGKEGAVKCAERLRREIAEQRFKYGKFALTATISLGVVSYRPGQQPPSGADIVKAADSALYESKRAGRNRVTTA